MRGVHLPAELSFIERGESRMSPKTDHVAGVGRWLVFGGVALMGSVIALAQVAAPPPPAPGAAPTTRTQPTPGTVTAPAQAAPARPNAAGERTQSTEPARAGLENRIAASAEGTQRSGLGIEFNPQTEGGLSIANIRPDSTAAQAGLRAGDKFISVDGRTFTSPRQLQAYLSGQFGRRVPIIVDRGGQQMNVQLSLNQPAGDVAWLGVFLQDNEGQQTGARIIQVYPAGPAARAGLR